MYCGIGYDGAAGNDEDPSGGNAPGTWLPPACDDGGTNPGCSHSGTGAQVDGDADVVVGG